MANPARLLYGQFLAWRGSGSQVAANTRQAAIHNGWQGHRIAVRHLDAIDELIRQMEDAGKNVRVAREQFPNWCSIVFAYPKGWQTRGTAEIDQTTLDHLDSFAERLADYVPVVKPGGLDEIRGYVDGIRQLLDEDDTITDPNLKMHVLQVMAHLIWCVDNYDAVGDFDLQEALERLIAAVMRAGAASGNKAKWKEWMDRIVWPFAVNMLASLPSAGLAQLALGG